MSLTNILVVAENTDIGGQVKDLLHRTGMDLLVLEVVTDPGGVPDLVVSWRPNVIVAQQGLPLEGVSTPVVCFDITAFDPRAVAEAAIHAAANSGRPDSEIQPPTPSLMPAANARRGIAIGLQGVKGGVGTTTIACAIAEIACRQRRKVAVIDLDRSVSDCAITLRARGDADNPHLFMSDEGILIVRAPADLNRVWNKLVDEYDVIVVDAGRAGEFPDAVRALARLGVLWFLVCSPETLERLDPGRYPGFRILLNRERARRWFQWDVAGTLPDDEQVTRQINQGAFCNAESPFASSVQGFTARLLAGEVV